MKPLSWRAYLALALALCLVVVARVTLYARRELLAGRAALAAGRADVGVRHLRRAAHLYLPSSPYTREAYDTLESFARESETRGQSDRALSAWRAVRSSALATRWLVVPHRDRLDRANRHIARLMSSLPAPPEDRGVARERLEERHLALLQEDRAPEPAWVVLLGAGLALWLGAAVWAARHAFDDDDRPLGQPLARAAGVFALGVALFLIALHRA